MSQTTPTSNLNLNMGFKFVNYTPNFDPWIFPKVEKLRSRVYAKQCHVTLKRLQLWIFPFHPNASQWAPRHCKLVRQFCGCQFIVLIQPGQACRHVIRAQLFISCKLWALMHQIIAPLLLLSARVVVHLFSEQLLTSLSLI